jgi:hypothetical protein
VSVRHTISAGAATSTRADTSRAPGISGSARTSTTTSRESGASTRSACPLASTDRVLPIAAGDALSCAAHCAAYARSLLRARPGSGDAAARQRLNNSAVRALRCCAHPAVSMSPHSFASSAVRYASDTTRSRACGETRARRLASANTLRGAQPYRMHACARTSCSSQRACDSFTCCSSLSAADRVCGGTASAAGTSAAFWDAFVRLQNCHHGTPVRPRRARRKHGAKEARQTRGEPRGSQRCALACRPLRLRQQTRVYRVLLLLRRLRQSAREHAVVAAGRRTRRACAVRRRGSARAAKPRAAHAAQLRAHGLHWPQHLLTSARRHGHRASQRAAAACVRCERRPSEGSSNKPLAVQMQHAQSARAIHATPRAHTCPRYTPACVQCRQQTGAGDSSGRAAALPLTGPGLPLRRLQQHTATTGTRTRQAAPSPAGVKLAASAARANSGSAKAARCTCGL